MKKFSQSKSKDSLGCSRHRDSEAWVKKRGTIEITPVIQLKTAVLSQNERMSIPEDIGYHSTVKYLKCTCAVVFISQHIRNLLKNLNQRRHKIISFLAVKWN